MLLKHDFDHGTLVRRGGPVLSDGTRFGDLFDFDRREVSLRVMYDPEIHELEKRRIFHRSWIVVGHDSEIPNPGDFMLRRIGEDPVIVTRGQDGSINLLLNICPHRGAEVCAADRGNTKAFTCPYHAWVFDNKGKLVGVPFEKAMYPENWDKSEYGLIHVNCVVRHGVIFGNLDDKPVSFEDYLGDMLWYFDALYGGREWVSLPSFTGRFLVHANWKTNCDQTHGDFLHVIGAHRSSYELGRFGDEGAEEAGQFAVKISTPPTGHMLQLFEPNYGREGKSGMLQTREALAERLSLPFDQRGWSATIYPTSAVNCQVRTMPDGSKVLMRNLAMHLPHGPGAFEFRGHNVTLVPADTRAETMEILRQGPQGPAQMGRTGGVSGIGMEDNDVWRSITTAARTPAAHKATLKYPSVAGPNKPQGWPGPGVVYDGFSHDDSQWHGWIHYYDLMTVDEA